jgi:hypothetical protein
VPAAATRQNPTETTHISTLSPVQAQVVAALAQGLTITAAAQYARIHRSTIYEWLKSVPGFQTAIRESRDEFRETLRDDLQTLSAKALSTLHEVLDDSQAPAGVRVRAALAVLERPQCREQAWNLPAPAASPAEQAILQQIADPEAGSSDALAPQGAPSPSGYGKDDPPVLAAC